MEKISCMLLSVLAILSMAGIARSEVVINEIMYDPSEPDTGNEWIELKNVGIAPQALTGYDLNAVSGDYYTLPTLSVPAGKFVVVHWRKDGMDDTDFSDNIVHLYTGTSGFDANMGNTSGWVALFNSSTHSSSTIKDYMEYGAGGRTWESTAVSAGIWTAGDFAADIVEGHSLEYDGSGEAGSDWFDQSAPTQGSDNSLPVTLSAFTALPGDGRIVLRWITESEIDNLGFNVYRSLKEDGEYRRINGDLIRGAGSSAMRSEYSFTDVRLTKGRTYYYKLEDVSFDGKHMLHGPIKSIPKGAAETEEEASEEEEPKRSQWGTVKHSMQLGEERD